MKLRPSLARSGIELAKAPKQLVNGWDGINNLNLYVYSLLGFSTLKNVKCFPAMTKARIFLIPRAFSWSEHCRVTAVIVKAQKRASMLVRSAVVNVRFGV